MSSIRLATCEFAGILLTYQCEAACLHCYENSGPQWNVALPVDDARLYMGELRQLGLTGPAIHFAGGEPFHNYGHLVDCLRMASLEKMLPLGKIETNAWWCTEDSLVRERLEEIRRFGIVELLVSSDIFHQQFVPLERVRRVVRIGAEILGKDRVRVRYWEFYNSPIDASQLMEGQRAAAFREELRQRPERIVGRAAKTLSRLLPRYPKDSFAACTCRGEVLDSRHVHIDPYGNIFPSVCAGLILGNAKNQKLAALMEKFNYSESTVVKTLVEKGPLPLLNEAIQHGFKEEGGGYASKCHVCFVARGFFWQKKMYRDQVGPKEVYE